MVAARAADRGGAAGVPRVRARRGARRPQRAVRHRVPAGRGRPLRPGRGRRSASLDTARLARRVLTRDEAPDCQLATLARALPRRPPRPTTARCADARATVDVLHGLIERLGTARRRSRSRSCTTFTARVTAAQRRKRHLAEGLPHAPGRLRVRGRARPGRSTSASPSDLRSPGPHLLHRQRDRAPGWPRWSASPSASTPIAVRHRARGRGARAAADRRAQAALQPPVAVPRARRSGSSSPSSRSRGCRSCASVTRRRRDLPRPVRLAARSAEPAIAALHEAVPLRQCTRGSPAHAGARPARWPRWAAAARRARARSRVDDYAVHADAVPRRARRRRRDRRRRGSSARMARLAAARALRGRRRRTATGSRPSSAPPPACSGSTALARLRRAGRRPARPATAAGSSSSSATAGSRGTGVVAARRRPRGRASRRCVATGRDRRRRRRPAAGGHRRGDRVRAALARAAGHPPGATSTGDVGLPGPAAAAPTRPARIAPRLPRPRR